ncbi:MAG: patatin-like phospholipase family protein [Marinilabiliales bacterium]
MRVLIFIAIIIITSDFAVSQKIGVVLSGGGAKGIAHVGVLKALEENGIPIDYIAGTSIGAIVGGLYAAGYSPEEMEELFLSVDFIQWAKGIIDNKHKYLIYEDSPTARWFGLEFSLDSVLTPKLPTYIIPTHQIDFELMRIFSPAIAKAKYNFDSLFVPFRCVAVDIYNNEQVIFRFGQLPSAIRASMSIPFYFKPIKYDGMLLFDGGILNNFPIDVIDRVFKPDLFIGSKVSFNSKKPNEDDLLSQIENLITVNTDFSIPAGKGILIEPDVNGIGITDWDKAELLIKNGYDETMRKIQQIKPKISYKVSKEEINKKRKEFKDKLPELKFQKITIEGLNNNQQKYLTKSIIHKNKLLDANQLKESYLKLLNDNKIESIYPKARYDNSTGFFNLTLDVKKKKRFEAEAGGNIASSAINHAYLGAKYHYLDKYAYTLSGNLYFGKLYNSFCLDGKLYNPVVIPQYYDLSLTFNRYDYFRSYSGMFFEDFRPYYVVRYETNVRASANIQAGKRGKLFSGASVSNNIDEYYHVKNFLKSDTADFTIFDSYCIFAGFQRKTLNFKQYGNEGSNFTLNINFVNGREKHFPGSTSVDNDNFLKFHKWIEFKISYDQYFKANKYFIPGLYVETVYSCQEHFSNYFSTILQYPEFKPFPHSTTLFLENFRSNIYLAGGLKTVIKISKNTDWRNEAYIFIPYQKTLENAQQKPYLANPLDYQYYMAYSSVVYHTPVGPVSLSINYYRQEFKEFYVFLNFGYILFNKKGREL